MPLVLNGGVTAGWLAQLLRHWMSSWRECERQLRRAAVPSRYKAPMPRMLPSRPDADTPDSERKVFTAFERHLPRDWTVFHSRRFVLPRQGGGSAESELDFLVIDPARGILGLEVKGGIEIGRDEEGWYSGSSPRHRIKSPGAQAQRAMHTLQDYLRTRASCPAFGWGVVFPDAEPPESLGPELPRRLVIAASSLQWADKAVDSVFEAAIGPGNPLSPAAVTQLVQLLAPRVSLAPSLSATLTDEGTALVRLTEEQFGILELLAAFPRVGVSGGAGTGKTLVAMERSRRLAADGRRVLLLCYNRGLAAYLKSRADGFTVSTFHSLCDALSRSAGLPWPVAPEGSDAQTFWRDQAPSFLLQALDRLPDERFDAVVVDEAQDFHEDLVDHRGGALTPDNVEPPRRAEFHASRRFTFASRARSEASRRSRTWSNRFSIRFHCAELWAIVGGWRLLFFPPSHVIARISRDAWR